MSNLNSSLEVLFNKMENFVSSKTVVGEPVSIDDVIIVPLVDVTVGVGAGSSSGKDDKKENGGGGLGAKITPSAVMVIQNGTVQLVDVKSQNSINKLIDMFPGVVSKLEFPSIFRKKEKAEETCEDIDSTSNNLAE